MSLRFSWELIGLLLVLTYIPYLFIYLFTYLFIYLFICLFIYLLSYYLSIYFSLTYLTIRCNFYFTYLPFPLPSLTTYFILFGMLQYHYFYSIFVFTSYKAMRK